MSSFADFQPIFARTEEDIRADYDARANAGLAPDDPDWVDTREGSMFFINTQPNVIEFAQAYDRMNEAVAAGILASSWGDKLDLWALTFGDARIAAIKAIGVVRFTGTPGTLIGTGVQVSPEQTDPEIDPPYFETTASGTIPVGGFLDLAVQAIQAGPEGNVAANSITVPQTGVVGVASITNQDPTSGGADVESDEKLKTRLQLRFNGKGSGTVAEYTREVLKWPGVGRVTVNPHFSGPGTVQVVISDEGGNPLPAQVTPLQTYLDPNPALGEGWAPINHTVTVVTTTNVTIYVTATIAFQPGYSLDGANGTVALRALIQQAVTDYIDGLGPGDDVIYNHVLGAFFSVQGVLNVSNLKTGTSATPTGTTDIAIAATSVAQPQSVILS